MINVKLGVSRDDDILSKRILSLRLADGETKEYIPDQETMLHEYHWLRDQSQDDIPTPEKLKELEGEL